MVSVVMKERTDRELATLTANDLLLSPALGEFSSANFHEAVSTIALGEAAAREASAKLAAFAVPEARWLAWRQAIQRGPGAQRVIGFVDVDGTKTDTEQLVARRTTGLLGKPLDAAVIEPFVSAVYAEGVHEHLAWRSERRDGRDGIVFKPIDKSWGPVFANFGLQFSDDFQGRSDYQLISEILATGISRNGAELRGILKLGRVTELSADWFMPLDPDRALAFGADAGWRAQNLPVALDDRQLAEYRIERARLGARLSIESATGWTFDASASRIHHRANPLVAGSVFPETVQISSELGARAAWDSLDRLSFPSSGARVVLSAEHFPGGLNDDQQGSILRARGDWAMSSGKHNLLLGGRWANTWGAPPGLAAYSTLGGFLNLSGSLERSLVDSQLAYARAVYYVRLGEQSGPLSVPPYLGFSAEVGNVWSSRRDMSASDLIGAGSAFIGVSSPFGPLLLGYGLNSAGGRTWTLSFGNLIRNDDQ
jgi:NTE family protein